MRIHDHAGNDLAGRIDGNAVRGRIPVEEVLDQLARGESAYRRGVHDDAGDASD